MLRVRSVAVSGTRRATAPSADDRKATEVKAVPAVAAQVAAVSAVAEAATAHVTTATTGHRSCSSFEYCQTGGVHAATNYSINNRYSLTLMF